MKIGAPLTLPLSAKSATRVSPKGSAPSRAALRSSERKASRRCRATRRWSRSACERNETVGDCGGDRAEIARDSGGGDLRALGIPKLAQVAHALANEEGGERARAQQRGVGHLQVAATVRDRRKGGQRRPVRQGGGPLCGATVFTLAEPT